MADPNAKMGKKTMGNNSNPIVKPICLPNAVEIPWVMRMPMMKVTSEATPLRMVSVSGTVLASLASMVMLEKIP